MSSRLGTTGVGEMFATQPPRAAALAGALPPRPRLVQDAPDEPIVAESESADSVSEEDASSEQQDEPSDSPPVDKERRARKAPAGRAARATKDEPPQTRLLLVVYVTQEDLDWVAQRRKATDLTNAQIVLAAIETAAPKLADRLRPASPSPGRSSMFATPTAKSPRPKQRHVQLGLSGVLVSDREVLDRLVADTGAESMSALVRAALEVARHEA